MLKAGSLDVGMILDSGGNFGGGGPGWRKDARANL